jgi:hypothetical protein
MITRLSFVREFKIRLDDCEMCFARELKVQHPAGHLCLPGSGCSGITLGIFVCQANSHCMESV